VLLWRKKNCDTTPGALVESPVPKIFFEAGFEAEPCRYQQGSPSAGAPPRFKIEFKIDPSCFATAVPPTPVCDTGVAAFKKNWLDPTRSPQRIGLDPTWWSPAPAGLDVLKKKKTLKTYFNTPVFYRKKDKNENFKQNLFQYFKRGCYLDGRRH